jgi:hypothetical protein
MNIFDHIEKFWLGGLIKGHLPSPQIGRMEWNLFAQGLYQKEEWEVSRLAS